MERKQIEEKIKKCLDFMEKECPECLEMIKKCCDSKDKNCC